MRMKQSTKTGEHLLTLMSYTTKTVLRSNICQTVLAKVVMETLQTYVQAELNTL